MEIKITYSTGHEEILEVPDGTNPSDAIVAKFGSGVALEESGGKYELMPDEGPAPVETVLQKAEDWINVSEVEAEAVIHKVEDVLHIKHA